MQRKIRHIQAQVSNALSTNKYLETCDKKENNIYSHSIVVKAATRSNNSLNPPWPAFYKSGMTASGTLFHLAWRR